jgi:hypothetical protein
LVLQLDEEEEICRRVNCPEESVRTICGNHDILRNAITNSALLQDAQRSLRKSGADQAFGQIDSRINAYFADIAAPELLFSTIRNYNEFADKWGCGFHATQPFWQQDFVLNDGSKLRLRGLNSALVSNASDDLGDGKLVLGPNFCVLPREEGVEYLVLCHHPPQWLWDQDRIDDYLNTRARPAAFRPQTCPASSDPHRAGSISGAAHTCWRRQS